MALFPSSGLPTLVQHQFFPARVLETIEYSIEDTYQGLYQELRKLLGKSRKGQPLQPVEDELTYARYGLWNYVVKNKQRQEPYATLQRAGTNLRGLIRVLLFKRFESSVYAFKETVRRLLRVHKLFLDALSQGIVPAGESAQSLLYGSDNADETDLLDIFKLAADEDEKAQVNLLEKAFRGPITTAINRELNLLRKNSVRSHDLLKSLGQIYFQHNMQDWMDNRSRCMEDDEVPRLICSEGLA